MLNSHKPYLAVPTKRGSIHHIWQLNGCVKWQCSHSKHQYFVCLVAHSIHQWIILNLWFGRSRGYSKLWKFFQNLKVDSLLEYSTLRWAHECSTHADDSCLGDIVLLRQLWGPIELTPSFGKKADVRLTKENSLEYSTKFWLAKYFNKETSFALHCIANTL